jgi:hypothetical protein
VRISDGQKPIAYNVYCPAGSKSAHFAPELLLEPCFLLLRPVRECSHLLKRDPDEIEAPRSGKSAETSRAAKMSIAGSNEELSIALERCQAFVCHWCGFGCRRFFSVGAFAGEGTQLDRTMKSWVMC